jgi:hypothetical protein
VSEASAAKADNGAEVKAWIDAYKARTGAASSEGPAAASPSAGNAGAGGVQGILKAAWQAREERGVQLAQFYVRAKRDIKDQGADVPEGTYGIRCSGLIQWDNGDYSSETSVYTPDSKLAFGLDFELAKARMSETEARAWREDYRSKFSPRGQEASQEELKKVYEERQKAEILANIPVKALRQINEQGANVPADTMGMLEGTLIRWDNGAYSDNLRRSQDFEVSRPLEKAR